MLVLYEFELWLTLCPNDIKKIKIYKPSKICTLLAKAGFYLRGST